MSLPITSVTVLEDRATVTRRGAVAVAAGQSRIVVEDVAAILVDKTLTASATNARVLDVRCERRIVEVEARTAGGLAALEAERATLAAELATLDARVATARAEVEALGEVTAAGLADLASAATRGSATPDASRQLAELDALDAAARARVVDGELAAADATRALRRLDDRVAQARAHAGVEVARLILEVVADAAADAIVTVAYVVPGAAWRPYHRATLVPGDQPRVEWQTTACIWQATGEPWVDAAITCSLERPSLGSEPPELADDELAVRRRPETVTVEAREQEHQTSGLGGGALEVPGIDDGGLGLVLTAARATIESDGAPHRIDVASFATPVQVSYVAIPLRSPWVHLRARIVNTGAVPVLAGPVDLIMASGYVGRAEVGFVAPGEKFYLGFGPEADLRIHRTETRERDEAGIISGATTQTTRIAVRLSNLGTARREVVVTERIPISEVEQVDVQLAAADAFLLADHEGGEEITQVTARALDDRGLVSWSVELPPQGRRAVTLEYRVKSARGVAGI